MPIGGVFGVLAKPHAAVAAGGPISIKVDSATGDVDNLVSGVSGKRIKVLGWILNSAGNADNTVDFRDDSTQLTGAMNCGPTHTCTAALSELGWFTLPVGAGLDMDIAGASVDVDGVVVYILVE